MLEAGPILEALDLDDVQKFADINGGAPELAIALSRRYGCHIYVVCMSPEGQFVGPDRDIETYLSRLHRSGIEDSDVTLVTRRGQLRGCDVVASIGNFGSRYKVRHLRGVFDKVLHGQSRVVIEIKKGSGSYPFLNDYGSCHTIRYPTDDVPGLAIMSVEPKSDPAGQWSDIAHDLVGRNGFFTDCGEHSFAYVPRGDTLVVTFDNLDIAMTKRENRRPWGFEFIENQGWSMLGVMANGWTWFRDQAVTEEFDRLRDGGFFAQFKRVVFYGASMGGYAAAAFSSASPGATVFAISPQSTLDKSVVPWENRYKTAWSRDFSGRYGDAAKVSAAADKVHLMYDPYVAPDAAHAKRFDGKNVIHWRCPLMGHRLGSSLHQMGILQDVARAAIDGTLDRSGFYRLLRARRAFPRFHRELANLALQRGHAKLAVRVCEYGLAQGENRYLEKMLRRLVRQPTQAPEAEARI